MLTMFLLGLIPDLNYVLDLPGGDKSIVRKIKTTIQFLQRFSFYFITSE